MNVILKGTKMAGRSLAVSKISMATTQGEMVAFLFLYNSFLK